MRPTSTQRQPNGAPTLGYSDGLAAVESGRTGYSGEGDFQELTGISALAIGKAMALAANRYAASIGAALGAFVVSRMLAALGLRVLRVGLR